jgi:hypothetical protein
MRDTENKKARPEGTSHPLRASPQQTRATRPANVPDAAESESLQPTPANLQTEPSNSNQISTPLNVSALMGNVSEKAGQTSSKETAQPFEVTTILCGDGQNAPGRAGQPDDELPTPRVQMPSVRVAQLEADNEALRRIAAECEEDVLTKIAEITELKRALATVRTRANEIELQLKRRPIMPIRQVVDPITWTVERLRRWTDYKLIASSPLFDSDWYFKLNPDLSKNIDAVSHYLTYGAAQGRDPCPLFDGHWYLLQNPDVSAAGIDPFVHYLRYGASEQRSPHPLFDVSYYIAQYGDLVPHSLNPIIEFCERGWKEGRNPHPLFDTYYYLSQNPVLMGDTDNPLLHYLRSSPPTALDPHPLFNSAFYVANCPEAATSGLTPLVHYLMYGAATGRRPHVLFDSAYYVGQFPQIDQQSVNPLIHYVLQGDRDPRRPNRLFDGASYIERYSDVTKEKMSALSHFAGYGAAEGRTGWSAEDAIELIREHALGSYPSASSTYWLKRKSIFRPPDGMQIAVYTSTAGNYFFHEIRDLIVAGLRSINVSAVALTENADRPNAITHDIFVAPHEFFNCNEKGRQWRNSAVLRSAIVLNTEQLQSKWFALGLPALLKARLVLDMNLHTAMALQDLGLNSVFFPLGYLSSFRPYSGGQRLPELPALSGLSSDVIDYKDSSAALLNRRPIDLLFIGTAGLKRDRYKVTSRRELFLSRNARQFSQYRCFFHVVWTDRPLIEADNALLSPEAVIGLCQRSKIVLNINSDEMPYFQWQRIVLHGVWQRALVVAENSHPIPGLTPGEHYFAGTLKEIPEAIEWFLRDKDGAEKAEEMRNAAFTALREKFHFPQILQSIVSKIADMN